jgi:hypothetical protein
VVVQLIKELSVILELEKVHHVFTKRLPLDPNMTELNPTHIFSPNSLKAIVLYVSYLVYFLEVSDEVILL